MAISETSKSSHELPVTTAESSGNKATAKKLTLIPLVFLIYFEVAGGPFGEEPAVQAAGPLLAILGFLIFPFIWSIPEALITAELSTAFPGISQFKSKSHKDRNFICVDDITKNTAAYRLEILVKVATF